jgi:hypothetical protein
VGEKRCQESFSVVISVLWVDNCGQQSVAWYTTYSIAPALRCVSLNTIATAKRLTRRKGVRNVFLLGNNGFFWLLGSDVAKHTDGGFGAACQFTPPGTRTHHGELPMVEATEGVLC